MADRIVCSEDVGSDRPAKAIRSVPGVSVVISVYNYAHYLPKCVGSVLDQTYPNVEIIVVDDGSTDGTPDVIAGFGRKVRYIRQENAGLSSARNVGTRAARHPFVAYLDADDEWLPDMLDYLMSVFEHLPPEFGMVACGCEKMTEDGRILQRRVVEELAPRVVSHEDLVIKNRFVADSVLIRRSIVEECGFFDTSLTSSEDRDLWIRIAAGHRVYLVPRKCVRVRVHQHSMSTDAWRMKANMLRTVGKARESGLVAWWNLLFWARAYSFLHFQSACMYHNRGAARLALADLLLSMLLWPCFLRPQSLNEPLLFRGRSCVRVMLDWLMRRKGRIWMGGVDVLTSPLVQQGDSDGGRKQPGNDPEKLPGVSVVIPAYNYAGFLPTAVASALRQNHPRKEVIVVDDGSTDNTREVVAEFGDAVRYIYQPNAGLSAARNTGLAAARFPRVAFLDADDEWMPGYLMRLGSAFEELPEDVAAIACQTLSMDQDGRLMKAKQLVRDLPREISFADILLKTRFSPSAVMVRKSVFEEVGTFDTELRSSEDRDMWLRVAARFRVYQLDEALALIRIHANNMSKHADRMKRNMRRVLDRAMKTGRRPGLWYRLKVKSFLHFQTAWMYIDEGRWFAGVGDLLFSLVCWPWFNRPQRLNEPPFFRIRSLIRFVGARGGQRHAEYQQRPL